MLIAAVALASGATAGDLVQSNSTRPGLFIAHLDGNSVRVYFKDKAHLLDLAQHCNAGKDVFSLQTGVKAKCNVSVPGAASELVDWGQGETTVQLSRIESDSPAFGVFSINPPRTIGWTIRQTTVEEADALRVLLASDRKKFSDLADELNLNDATAVGKPNGESFLVVVPGRVVVEHEGLSTYHFHHLFVRHDGPYSYVGEIHKPYFLVDLDGTDLPAIVTTTSCDGTCAKLVTITSDGVEGVAVFSGH
jgi:hypothetical protein